MNDYLYFVIQNSSSIVDSFCIREIWALLILLQHFRHCTVSAVPKAVNKGALPHAILDPTSKQTRIWLEEVNFSYFILYSIFFLNKVLLFFSQKEKEKEIKLINFFFLGMNCAYACGSWCKRDRDWRLIYTMASLFCYRKSFNYWKWKVITNVSINAKHCRLIIDWKFTLYCSCFENFV